MRNPHATYIMGGPYQIDYIEYAARGKIHGICLSDEISQLVVTAGNYEEVTFFRRTVSDQGSMSYRATEFSEERITKNDE